MTDVTKTILVIEDDDSIQFVIQEVLESIPYRVKSASNGLAGLELLKNEGLPDLILLDMRMPIMDGWQFAARFRNLYNHSVPLIVMTAAADASQRAAEINAEDYLGKPFELKTLLTKIQRYLR